MALVAVGPCVPPCALGAQACFPGTAAVTDRAGERGAKKIVVVVVVVVVLAVVAVVILAVVVVVVVVVV